MKSRKAETEKPGFLESGDVRGNFQYLEDLATAYWYSEVLFAGIELGLFDHIESGPWDTRQLARQSGCRPEPLARLLRAMMDMGLVWRENQVWYNGYLARRHLLRKSSDYLGDFLFYRHYMKPRWETILEQTCREPADILKNRPSPLDDYRKRNFYYVRALDALSRQKAREIAKILETRNWRTPILDLGCGAGALSRELIRSCRDGYAVMADLTEVFAAARKIYKDPEEWGRLASVACDARRPPFKEGAFGLVLMSNILHAYDAKTAERLLDSTLRLLAPEGTLLIHDYFPDRVNGLAAPRGSLQDLNMMLNTYNGVCHDSETVVKWLGRAQFGNVRTRDLASDSSVILASRGNGPDPGELADRARAIGLDRAVEIKASDVVTAPWVRVKCRFGCENFGQNKQCPPSTTDLSQTRAVIENYRRALLVVGQPPGRVFHEKMLALEKEAFLSGYHKALTFGAGPCTVCDRCPDDEPCRFPSKSRPSMEASGIDVYATASKAGLVLSPVPEKGRHVTYVGLMLIE